MGPHGQKSRQRPPAARSHYGHLLRAMGLRGVHQMPTQVGSTTVLACPAHPILPTNGQELSAATRQGSSSALDFKAILWLFGHSACPKDVWKGQQCIEMFHSNTDQEVTDNEPKIRSKLPSRRTKLRQSAKCGGFFR